MRLCVSCLKSFWLKGVWVWIIIFAFSLSLSEAAQIPVKVVGQEVNLRSSPSTSSSSNIIGRVVYSQCFVAIEKQSDATYGAWYKIAIPSSRGAEYGWVAQKNASGVALVKEDYSLSSYIVTIQNDGGVGWRLRYLPADYDDYLEDTSGGALKVWNGQSFIYKSYYPGSSTDDGCRWWEIYIPYLKVSLDWNMEDYDALFVRDDAIRPTGFIEGYVKNRAGKPISGAVVKPYLKDNRTEDYWKASTSSSGYYKCSSLPESTYTLKVDAQGYTSAEIKNVSVSSGGTARCDVTLDENTPPTITNVRISPSSLSSSGGKVTISADVTDNVGIQSVYAFIKKPDGKLESLSMYLKSGNTYECVYTAPANSSNSTQTYYVDIDAFDLSYNLAETGYAYSFTVSPPTSNPPSKPSNPSPPDGATDQSTSLTLSWSASGATEYDVYFGTSSPPPLYKAGLTTNQLSVSGLQEGTTYYWKIVAKNQYGSTEGDVWRFTTKKSSTGRFSIGDRVCVTGYGSPLKVRSTPEIPSDNSNVLAKKVAGQEGEIRGGPTDSGKYRWWKIRWPDGIEGWSAEGDAGGYFLEALPGAGVYPQVSNNNCSYRVRVYRDADPEGLAVRWEPSKSSTPPITVQHKDARGWTLDAVPVAGDNLVWWLIKWDDGTVGWSADSQLNYGVYLVKEGTGSFSGTIDLSNAPNSTIDFGTVKPGEYKDLSISIKNNPNSTVVLKGKITVSGTGFKLLASDEFSLWPGAKRVITARFAPTSEGEFSGTLSFTHNAGNYSSPITYTLKGQGKSGAQNIKMSYSPSSIDFGAVEVNTSAEQILRITNDSASTDNLSVSLSNPGTGFSIVNDSSFTVAPGQSHDVKLRFTPTEAKSYASSLRITHNATNISSPLEIPLAGSGSTSSFTLTIYIDPTNAGKVTVNGEELTPPIKKKFNKGDSVKIEALPNSGYKFVKWQGDISSTNSSLSFTIDRDITITAQFAAVSSDSYTLTIKVSPDKSGQIRVNNGQWSDSYSEALPKDSSVQIEAQAKSGFKFNRWSGDVPSNYITNNPLTIKLSGNYVITALFTDTEAPSIANFNITPSKLDKPQGIVTISADVTDNVGLKEVKLQITEPNGEESTFSKRPDGKTYTFDYAVNNESSSWATYNVKLIAIDLAGNSSSCKGSFSVAPGGGNRPPNKPRNISPNGPVNSLDVTLSASPFKDPDGDTHQASEWQVLELKDNSCELTWNETTKALTKTKVPRDKLDWGKTYSWSVRYQDSKGNWSDWSDPTSFWTPLNPSPSAGDHIIPEPVVNGQRIPWEHIYVNQVYSTAAYEDSKDFDGFNACGPSSAVMVAAYFGKLKPDPDPDPKNKIDEDDSSSFGWYVAHPYIYEWNGDKTDFCKRKANDYPIKNKNFPHPPGNGRMEEKEWPGAHGYILVPKTEKEWVGSPDRIKMYLMAHGINSQKIDFPGKGFLTNKMLDRIKEEIDNKHPVIINILLKENSGHFVVVVGYHANEKGEIDQLILLDPWKKNSGVDESTGFVQYAGDYYTDYNGKRRYTGLLSPLRLKKKGQTEYNLQVRQYIITAEKMDDSGQVIMCKCKPKQTTQKQEKTVHLREDEGFVLEIEPNDEISSANQFTDDIGGVINPGTDVDWFKFNGSKGEKVSLFIRANMDGSPLDAKLSLYAPDGETLLAENDDDEIRGTLDPAIWHFTLPDDGTYYIKVESYDGSGGEDSLYTLCFRKEVDDDFGDDFSTATPLLESQREIHGTIGHPGDVDVFRFDATQGETLTVDIRARRDGSPLDAVLTLYNQNGEIIGHWDDINSTDPTVKRFQIENDGTYYLQVKDYEGDGGEKFTYTLNWNLQPRHMADVDVTGVSAEVTLGDAQSTQRAVANIGGGVLGFASVGKEEGKGARQLNPFTGKRKVIFSPSTTSESDISPKDIEHQKEAVRRKAPNLIENKDASKPSISGPTFAPLRLSKKSAVRIFRSRQGEIPPSPTGWRWVIADPVDDTPVENACNISKVLMQRGSDALYFRVETQGRSPEADAFLIIYMDTDLQVATGAGLFTNFGSDYAIVVGGSSNGLWSWNATTEEFEFVADLCWSKVEENAIEVGVPIQAINNGQLDEFGMEVELFDLLLSDYDVAPDEGFAIISSLPSWLRVEPLAGSANAGQEVEVAIKLDTGALEQTGQLDASLTVYSSDPNKPESSIPVELIVKPPELPFTGQGLMFLSSPLKVDQQWHEVLQIDEQNIKLACWDTAAGTYRYYPELDAQSRKPTPGVGVWLKLENPITATIKGIPPKAIEPFAIALKQGWNAIGVPWQVKWANLRVRKDTEEVSFQEAQDRGWIYEVLWSWDSQASDYQMVWGGALGIGLLDTLEPFKGYWIMALQDCQLVIPPKEEAVKAVKTDKRQLAKNGFVFGLSADNGKVKRRVWLGFTSNDAKRALQLPLPPEAPSAPSMRIYALSTNGQPLAVDVRNGLPQKIEWDVIIKWDNSDKEETNKEIVLTFDGVGYAPKDVGLWLLDLTTGKRTYLRTIGAYRFTPSPDETERRFKVIAERETSRLVWITGLRATSMRGEGVVISFNLTKPAQIKVEIQNLSGQRVAVLSSGEMRQAGEQKFIWRGTDEEGKNLPSGVYLIRVLAMDEEIRQAQAITMTVLR